jgi:ABC-type antimicrobial peptide transport system permease subunit
VRLRFVAALTDSIFQSELVMSEANFRRAFPDQAGYQMFLVETAAPIEETSREIEQGLSDAGGDAVATGAYLASFHRVENTYLSTFQTLGGLGLLLGTLGLAAVLLRNALERRRELALLAAVGYRRAHFIALALLENLVIIGGGLIAGAVCASIAIAPAALERGVRLPLSAGAMLMLFAVFVVAMAASLAAVAAATRTPVLEALRSE